MLLSCAETAECHVDFRWECIWVRTVKFRSDYGEFSELWQRKTNPRRTGRVSPFRTADVVPDHLRVKTLQELTAVVPGPDHELLQGFRHLKNGSQVWLPSEYPDFEAMFDRKLCLSGSPRWSCRGEFRMSSELKIRKGAVWGRDASSDGCLR